MKLLRKWKLILSFLLVFVAGGIAGAVLTHLKVKRWMENMSWTGWAAHHSATLERRLNLTEEQTPAIRGIVENLSVELRANFNRAIEASKEHILTAERRIDAELTEEQRRLHREFKEEVREHLRKGPKIELPLE